MMTLAFDLPRSYFESSTILWYSFMSVLSLLSRPRLFREKIAETGELQGELVPFDGPNRNDDSEL